MESIIDQTKQLIIMELWVRRWIWFPGHSPRAPPAHAIYDRSEKKLFPLLKVQLYLMCHPSYTLTEFVILLGTRQPRAKIDKEAMARHCPEPSSSSELRPINGEILQT